MGQNLSSRPISDLSSQVLGTLIIVVVIIIAILVILRVLLTRGWCCTQHREYSLEDGVQQLLLDYSLKNNDYNNDYNDYDN